MRALAVVLLALAACAEPGPAGARGPAGPQGPKGDKGDQGPAGNAPLVQVLNCDREMVRVAEGAGGSRHWFAEMLLDEGVGVTDIEAVAVCDREDLSSRRQCEASGETCTGYSPPEGTCRPGRWRFDEDLLVVECGEERTSAAGNVTGERFDRAVVRVRR